MTRRKTPAPPKAMRRLPWRPLGAAALVCCGVATIWWSGLPAAALASAGHAANLRATHVELTGLRHTPRLAVERALALPVDNALLDLNPHEIRERLLALPWVADATVERDLPSTLRVHLAERTPAALWQLHGRLRLVDATGRVLASDNLEPFADLPIVIGPDANTEAHNLFTLVRATPRLASRLDSAAWVGARRWDVRLKSGEQVALPEGYGPARAALLAFDRLDRQDGLTGRGIARFDLRLPGKMVVRVNAGLLTPPKRSTTV